MPINKEALKRYRIIDKLLSDRFHDYTTREILEKVNRECPHVSARMIQKDIQSIELEFGKSLTRGDGGKGTVRYSDGVEPIFNPKMTEEEEILLREVLKSIGQFDGLDNFTWLDTLKRKLEMREDKTELPVIAFSRNEGLQMPEKLLGRLFMAISERKTIKIAYTPFNKPTNQYVVYPYQLKQYNNRWFLLCTPAETSEFPFNPYFLATFALDRMAEDIEFMDDMPYIQTPVDFQARFDEIVGVTLKTQDEVQEIVFAVRPSSVDYIKTKYIHITQFEFPESEQERLKRVYPSLSDCTFFSIECRINYELLSLIASYMDSIVVVKPKEMKEQIINKISRMGESYAKIHKI